MQIEFEGSRFQIPRDQLQPPSPYIMNQVQVTHDVALYYEKHVTRDLHVRRQIVEKVSNLYAARGAIDEIIQFRG